MQVVNILSYYYQGLHFSGCIYYVIEYCLTLLSKHVSLVIYGSTVTFSDQKLNSHQSVTKWDRVH